MPHPPTSPTLADRYGAPDPTRRRAATVAIAATLLLLLGWLAWATWAQATPQVESELTTYDVTDAGSVDVSVLVSLDTDVQASCTITALAGDHQTVGQVSFVPSDGMNTISIRTERSATAVDLVGCTTAEQTRPR